MHTSELRFRAVVATLAVGVVVGCGDDSNGSNGIADSGADGEAAGSGGRSGSSSTGGSSGSSSTGGSSGKANGSGGAYADSGSGASAGAEEGGGAGGAEEGGGADGAEEDGGATNELPELPDVLSLSGCETIGLGPLCSVTQERETFTANCGGKHFTGVLNSEREVTFTTEDSTTDAGAAVDVSCAGEFALGRLTAECTRSTSAIGDASAHEETCEVTSDRQILPGVACMELPAEVDGLTICTEGEGQGGTTISAGTCRVIQDGCAFQAECTDDLVLTGSVSRTGISFAQPLAALADAETPEDGEPAFIQGAVVNHSCTATLDGGTLSGSCGAGAVRRRGTPTSVCSVEGEVETVPSCNLIAPNAEQIFALNSCEILEEGAEGEEGIGEPVCVFRQNGCIWDIQCGSDPTLHYSGRVTEGASKVEWTLALGAPCEMTFDSEGNMSGKCSVPGVSACELGSKPATAGTNSCPAVIEGTSISTRGCGDAQGDALDCRLALQHKCNFMAVCGFTERFPDVVISGETSFDGDRAHFEFAGLNGYDCAVDQATLEDVSSGDRQSNEWYGQCTNPSGRQCRDNWNPDAGTGFRGLQIFIGEAE